MLTIAFWNVAKRQSVLPHVTCLRMLTPIDIFILAEAPKNLKPAVASLNKLNVGKYAEVSAGKAKVRAVSRLPSTEFKHGFTSTGKDMVVWTLKTNTLPQGLVLLAGLHLPAKMGGASVTDQHSDAREVIQELVSFENLSKTRQTVLVGDFNMRPYDEGMTSATGVHAMMTEELAGLPDRKYRKRPYRRFYNPMWGLMGDRTPGPPGTFFWRASLLHNTQWQMLDQVLLRSDLVDRLDAIEILEHDGNHDLVGLDGTPSKDVVSDHLPLVFRLNI